MALTLCRNSRATFRSMAGLDRVAFLVYEVEVIQLDSLSSSDQPLEHFSAQC